MDKSLFSGIIVPIVSPCLEDDSLDLAALESNYARLMESPIDGMYLCGGTGDATRLRTAERRRIAELLVPRLRAAGKCAIVHVGQTTQRDAVELALHARELGADAISSIPPRAGWNEIVSYYRALTATGIPVIVYYIPGVTGVTAGTAELRRLLDLDGVIGIKVSDWNLFLMRSLAKEYPDKVVYTGLDELLPLGLLYGADGSIGTWQNLLPDMYAAVYRAIREDRYNDIIPLQEAFTDFLALGWDYGILDTFEELMRAKGYAQRCFRRPSSWNPGKVDAAALEKLVARLDALEEMSAKQL